MGKGTRMPSFKNKIKEMSNYMAIACDLKGTGSLDGIVVRKKRK